VPNTTTAEQDPPNILTTFPGQHDPNPQAERRELLTVAVTSV
jgi:hypothetical protein